MCKCSNSKLATERRSHPLETRFPHSLWSSPGLPSSMTVSPTPKTKGRSDTTVSGRQAPPARQVPTHNRSASETDPRWWRGPGPWILKKHKGAVPDTSLSLGDTAVNISGKACLQGMGEHIINKQIAGSVFGGVKG